MAVSINFEGQVVEMPALRSGVSKNGTNWAIQEYVIDVPDDKYPSKLCFEVFGEDKIEKFGIHLNDVVSVKANISSTGWNGKFFTSIRAWSVNIVSKGTVAPPQAQKPAVQKQQVQQSKKEEPAQTVTEDDLPF